jgi:hypothetical protein
MCQTQDARRKYNVTTCLDEYFYAWDKHFLISRASVACIYHAR